MRHVYKAVEAMNAVLTHLLGAMMGVMVLVVALQIVVRFLLPRLGIVASVPWSEELARYLMIWCIFLGAAVATRRGTLIAMDTVADALPEALGRAVRTLALLITVLFFGMLIWLGLRWMHFGEGETSTVMSLPMSWVYAAMPVGSAVAIVNIVTLMVERWHERRTLQASLDAEAAASIV